MLQKRNSQLLWMVLRPHNKQIPKFERGLSIFWMIAGIFFPVWKNFRRFDDISVDGGRDERGSLGEATVATYNVF